MDNNRKKYHIEMMLNTLRKMKFPSETGDTRNYLDIDETERSILIILLHNELNRINEMQRL